jgi:carboxyl-terminal processing protease
MFNRRTLFFYIVVLLLNNISFAQNNAFEIEKHKSLCQVWGYLKYYHPDVANGKYDWDKVLIDKYAQIQAVNDEKKLHIFYNQWLLELDNSVSCDDNKFPTPSLKDSLFWNREASWLDNSNYFSSSFSKALKCLFINKNFQKNIYVSLDDKNGNVAKFNEKNYKDMKCPSEAYRYLACCRLWNCIKYFCPYQYNLQPKWSDRLNQFIPLFTNAKDKESYEDAIRTVMVSLDDAHAQSGLLYDLTFRSKKYPSFQTSYLEDTLFVTRVDEKISQKENIQFGDAILEFNGTPIKKYTDSLYNLFSGSKSFKKRYLGENVFRTNTLTIKLKILRAGKVETVETTQLSEPVVSKPSFDLHEVTTFDNDKIGYISFGYVSTKTLRKTLEDFCKTKESIIIDLRKYPIDEMDIAMDYLLPKKTPFIYYSEPDLKYPGLFSFTKPEYCGKDNPDYFKGKVVVICGEYTISYGEQLCAMLKKCPRVKFVGEPTAAADGNISSVELPGANKVRFTGLGVYSSNGELIQHNGIKVDYEVVRTMNGVRLRKDIRLEKAVEIIKNEQF